MRTTAQMLAADYTEVMPDTCSIKTYVSLGNDRINKPIYDWTVTQTGVKCRREIMTQAETTVSPHVNAEFRFYLEPGIAVTERNRITFDGAIYEIVWVAKFEDLDAAFTQEVWCNRME